MSRNEPPQDNYIDYVIQQGLDAIARVDDRAERGPKQLPRYVVDACAHGVTQTISRLDHNDPQLVEAIFRSYLALTCNLYRAGYADGFAAAEARLNVGEG